MEGTKYYCINCKEDITDWFKPVICCSGRDCGCMGLPIEPPICSENCWNEFINKNKDEGDIEDYVK